jgi:ABC-type Fe3+-hydroxamate transport system substrate-binding protein
MEQKQIAILAVVAITIVAIVAAFVLMNNNGGSSDDPAETFKDAVGRTVEVPENLDNGIVTVGWWVPAVVAYFDAHQHVIEVDKQETLPIMGNMQPHYYAYDMNKMKVHEDTMMGQFSEKTIEDIAAEKPSLVVMEKYVYDKFVTGTEALAKACTVMVVDLSVLMGDFWVADTSGNLTVAPSLQTNLEMLATAFKEDGRDDKIVATLNDTLKDIVSGRGTSTEKFNLTGASMAMANGDFSVIFPMFNSFNLAGVINAATGQGMPPYADIGIEKFTTAYDFDVIMFDPSNVTNLTTANNQAALKWLYGLQGTSEEKEIYVLLPTALCGYNMLNVVSDAYFTQAVAFGDLDEEEFEAKMVKLYNDLFGKAYGQKIWDGLCEVIGKRGGTAADTSLWCELKVAMVEDKYTLVEA